MKKENGGKMTRKLKQETCFSALPQFLLLFYLIVIGKKKA